MTTTRILLTASELDTLLLSSPQERQDGDLAALIHLDEVTRENVRWAAVDAEESDCTARWAAEREAEGADA